MTQTIRATLVATLSLAIASPLAGQTTVVDEGTFRLYVDGNPVGTETFAIRTSGSGPGATTVAQGRIVLDTGEQTRALIQAEGPGLRPAAYQIEVAGPEPQKITGQAAGTRFRATIVSSAGEQMREYIASQGAVVLDDAVAHQYYFLAELAEGARIPIIIPRQSRQLTAQVDNAGSERITIGGETVEARRISVQPEGLDARTVWVDDQNRVLRLRIPDQDFTAERTTLP